MKLVNLTIKLNKLNMLQNAKKKNNKVKTLQRGEGPEIRKRGL